MTFLALAPDDVYAQVLLLKYIVYGLCVLVMGLVTVKVIFGATNLRQAQRMERLLRLAEMHGRLSEEQRQEAKQTVKQAAETAEAAAKVVIQVAAETPSGITVKGSGPVEMHGPRSMPKGPY